MIKTIEMFTVVCDGCGADVCEGEEFSAWNDEGYVEDIASNNGWEKVNDKHYCDDCFEYDDNGEIILKLPANDL